MINIENFYRILTDCNISFFVGVPDSYLNGFCNYLLDIDPERNIIAANEGNAIAIAAGHYIATQEIPLVYMQNSGMGNSLNPLVSLADENVYSIPMILLIGWRGRPGTGDWPQHKRQGEITLALLDDMGIPYSILTETDYARIIKQATEYAYVNKQSYAIVVPKGILDGKKDNVKDDSYPMSRNEAIETVLNAVSEDAIFVATTGRATRELYYLRQKRKEDTSRDFLNVGSMGHASSVAMGMALARPDKEFVILDGDAAAIMHMGAMTMAGKLDIPNLLHIVLNNGTHESVGGQPSAGFLIDFCGIAKACGYECFDKYVKTKEALTEAVYRLSNRKRAGFIEVRIHNGMDGGLPPLNLSHMEAIGSLMNTLEKKEIEK